MDRDDRVIVVELVLWPFKSALHAVLMWTGWFQEMPDSCPICKHDKGHTGESRG